MTPQPLLSCWSAIVAYLLVSPWAFWMSASKPASVNALSSAGRSPFSQRGEDAASGRMTQARVEAASVAPPPPVPEQPVSTSAAALAATAIEIHEDFFTSLPFCVGEDVLLRYYCPH